MKNEIDSLVLKPILAGKCSAAKLRVPTKTSKAETIKCSGNHEKQELSVASPYKRSFPANRTECSERWFVRFERPPPKYMSVQLMQKILAYEEQVRAHGGHSNAVKRTFKQSLKQGNSARTRKNGGTNPSLAPLLREGTYLVREWNGRTYQIKVLENGFQLDNKFYRSLSSVAQKITGSHWSGPRFFGLKRRKGMERASI